MRAFRITISSAVTAIVASLGLIGLDVGQDGRLGAMGVISLAALMIACMVGLSAFTRQMLSLSVRPQAEAWQQGFELGYNRGWAEGNDQLQAVDSPIPIQFARSIRG